MSPIYLYNGKILLRDNKIATNENCCCVVTTPTVTPTPSPIVGPGCDCAVSLAGLCSSITWSMNTMYDVNGNQFDITDTVNFAGLFHFYVSGTNPAVEVTAANQCNIVNKQLILDLSITLLFAPNGAVSYYCKPNGLVGEGVYNSQTFTKQIVIEECDMNGFGDLTGNYNMDLFGNNCPQGDSTFQATWSLLQCP